ncbi:hypothetical protein GZL_07647 [Streptomyces sp. 769]|nr:hypothetical protein GZL_07647 [Streptomyces sp. 769]
MSLPWAARGLKIPYVVRNDRQSRGPVAAALNCYKKLAKPATWDLQRKFSPVPHPVDMVDALRTQAS